VTLVEAGLSGPERSRRQTRRLCTWLSYAYGALVAAGIGYFLWDLPVQVSDSYGNIVTASQGTLGSLISSEFHQRAYLRPFLWGLLRVVLDLSRGHYFEWFRGWHIAQIAVLIVLFLRLVRPSTWSGAAAVPIGLAALIGMHTFAGTVQEAFPINTFMTVLICAFAAADLALGPAGPAPPKRWAIMRAAGRDVTAALLFVFAALTVESGLLVGVVFVAAYLVGARGVSRAGIGVQFALIAAYFVLRFAILHVGSPGLEERQSGFGFSSLSPDDLVARFGPNPLPFYAYNVVSSWLTVFLSEPRGGTWGFTRDLLRGAPSPTALVNVVASMLGSFLLGLYAWRRRNDWRARRFDRADRLVLVFIVVAAANAVLSYGYTKDVILSPAGAFFAVALAVASQHFLESIGHMPSRHAAAAIVMVAVLSTTWSFRAIGAHLGLRASASALRGEWAYVDLWLERKSQVPTDPFAIALKRRLEDDAVRRHPLRPMLAGEWTEWFPE
jgi:hypothetical protein